MAQSIEAALRLFLFWQVTRVRRLEDRCHLATWCLMTWECGVPAWLWVKPSGSARRSPHSYFRFPLRRSPSAATGRHLPFGPAVKCWHAQRHIGFHYFHSYEGATVDSDRATTAHPPPPRAFPHHLETQPCAPMKTNLFRCHLMILHHLANKMFYDATGFLPPGSLPKKRGVS